jgi:ABC-type transport system substrate-binding protein
VWSTLYSVLSVLIVSSMLLTSCAAPSASPTQAPAKTDSQAAPQPTKPAAAPTPAVPAAPAAQATTTPAAKSAGDAKPAAGGGNLRVILGVEVGDLDAHTTTTTEDNTVRNHIYDTLVRWTKGFEVGPGLAERWEVASDNKTYTFHLRTGVKFHDGTPFSAEAVKFNLDRVRGMQTSAGTTLRMIDSVQVVDEKTVKVSTQEPFGPFLRHLATTSGSIQSPDAIKKWDKEYGLHPVGTGPFKFVEWIKGDRLVLERNPEYWGEEPKVARITFRPVKEETVRVTALNAGEADIVTRIPPQDVEGLKKNERVTMSEAEANRTIFFYLNVSRPPFDNQRVRQAVNHAIDKQGIVKAILNGAGTVADSLLARTSFGYSSVKVYEYNPDEAKKMLQEAGYDFNSTVTMWAPQGRYVRDKEIAEAVQGQLQAIGMKVNLRVWGDLPAYFNSLPQDDYEIAMMGWSATSGDAAWGFDNIIDGSIAGKPFNFFRVNDPKINDLLANGRTTLDDPTREKIYAEVQQYERDQALAALVTFQIFYTGLRQGVDGLIIRPTEELNFNQVTLP